MARLECGRRLAEKKASLAHGEWLRWFAANEYALGFKKRTAQALMKAAALVKAQSTALLDMPAAIKLSRKMLSNREAQQSATAAANSGNADQGSTAKCAVDGTFGRAHGYQAVPRNDGRSQGKPATSGRFGRVHGCQAVPKADTRIRGKYATSGASAANTAPARDLDNATAADLAMVLP